MDPDDLRKLLREGLPLPQNDAVLVVLAERRIRRRRARSRAWGLASTFVLAAAAVGAPLLWAPVERSVVVADATSGDSTSGHATSGDATRTVTFGQLAISVPAGWVVQALPEGTSGPCQQILGQLEQPSVLIYESVSTTFCDFRAEAGRLQVPGVLAYAWSSDEHFRWARANGQELELPDVEAWRVRTHRASWVVVPDLQGGIMVSRFDSAMMQRVLRSLRRASAAAAEP